MAVFPKNQGQDETFSSVAKHLESIGHHLVSRVTGRVALRLDFGNREMLRVHHTRIGDRAMACV
jgi:hypothetical protein